MSQHTPGPWYQTASDPAGICIYAEDKGAHRRVAVLDTEGINGAGAANARLIAAAPAMANLLAQCVDKGLLDGIALDDARALLKAIDG